MALATDLEVAKGQAQWRNPELKPHVEAHHPSVVEGVDGEVSAWVADECDSAALGVIATGRGTSC